MLDPDRAASKYPSQPLRQLLQRAAGMALAMGMFGGMLMFVLSVHYMNQSQIHRAILHRRRIEVYALRLNRILNLMRRAPGIENPRANFL